MTMRDTNGLPVRFDCDCPECAPRHMVAGTDAAEPPKKRCRRRWWQRSPEAVEAFDFNIRHENGEPS